MHLTNQRVRYEALCAQAAWSRCRLNRSPGSIRLLHRTTVVGLLTPGGAAAALWDAHILITCEHIIIQAFWTNLWHLRLPLGMTLHTYLRQPLSLCARCSSESYWFKIFFKAALRFYPCLHFEIKKDVCVLLYILSTLSRVCLYSRLHSGCGYRLSLWTRTGFYLFSFFFGRRLQLDNSSRLYYVSFNMNGIHRGILQNTVKTYELES